jgi:hypothetical protein
MEQFGPYRIDGRLYLDMRLVEGRDLKELLEDGPLDPARAAGIVVVALLVTYLVTQNRTQTGSPVPEAAGHRHPAFDSAAGFRGDAGPTVHFGIFETGARREAARSSGTS